MDNNANKWTKIKPELSLNNSVTRYVLIQPANLIKTHAKEVKKSSPDRYRGLHLLH
jgi:hypothetical protein